MEEPYDQNFKSAKELFNLKSDISFIVKDTRNKNVSGKRLLIEQATIPSYASKKRAIGKIGCVDGEISFCVDEIEGVLRDSIVLYRKMIRNSICKLQSIPYLPLREVMTNVRAIEQELSAFIEEDEMNEDIVSLFSDENDEENEEEKEADLLEEAAGISHKEIVDMEQAIYTL
jgi:hypothetical protein